MTGSMEFEPRPNELSDLEIIANRQADWLTEQITSNSSESELFRNNLKIERVEDPSLFCEFPAKIEDDGIGSRFTLLYDQPTVDKLVHRYGEAYRLTRSELAELYIGTAIAARLLKNEIQDTNVRKFKKLMAILIDKDSLLDEIMTNEALSTGARTEIAVGTAQSSEDRIGRINILRFAFGMVYARAGETVDEETSRLRQTPLMLQFKTGLIESVKYRDIYLKMGEFFEKSRDEHGRKFDIDGESVAMKVFADATGDFEIAACFPMSWKEIQKILKTVS